MNMKPQIKVLTLSTVIFLIGLTGCSNKAARINPGVLEVSNKVDTYSAKITNITALSKKEVPEAKVLQGLIIGALVGAAITNDASEDAKEAGIIIGSIAGEYSMIKKYGKTIYRLNLALEDGTYKEVYVRGGHYQIGRVSKVTINKESGEISSFKLMNS